MVSVVIEFFKITITDECFSTNFFMVQPFMYSFHDAFKRVESLYFPQGSSNRLMVVRPLLT